MMLSEQHKFLVLSQWQHLTSQQEEVTIPSCSLIKNF